MLLSEICHELNPTTNYFGSPFSRARNSYDITLGVLIERTANVG